MIKQVIEYISSNQLFSTEDSLIIGVSGGIDSVVLLHLLMHAGYSCSIAHCNFGLRGTESNEDEEFVKLLANKYNIKIHSTIFNTTLFAEENDISIQMAARELRYNWFENLCQEFGYSHIAIAHQMDDSIETFFINLVRGSGLKGLTGIKPAFGKIVRPILFASRKEIKEYAQNNNLTYREDSSNSSTKYTRNLIRHKVLPLLEEINPNFRSTLATTIDILNKTEKIYSEKINDAKKNVVKENTESIHINIYQLQKLNPNENYLFEFLKPYQFTYPVVEEIVQSLNGISGKLFYSPTHQLLKDRSELIISPIKSTEMPHQHYINIDDNQINSPIYLKFDKLTKLEDFDIHSSSNIAYVDFDKLFFPLILRKWKSGDFFIPLGMQGIKKLSNFFIDNKINRHQKENTWLLCSGEKIVWIVGQRIDERFKITNQTKNILKIRY